MHSNLPFDEALIILLPPILDILHANITIHKLILSLSSFVILKISLLPLQFVSTIICPVTSHATYPAQVILLRLRLDVFRSVLSILFRCLHWFQKLKPQPFAEVRHLSRYFVRLVAQRYSFIPHIYSEGSVLYQCICKYNAYGQRNVNPRYYRGMVDLT